MVVHEAWLPTQKRKRARQPEARVALEERARKRTKASQSASAPVSVSSGASASRRSDSDSDSDSDGDSDSHSDTDSERTSGSGSGSDSDSDPPATVNKPKATVDAPIFAATKAAAGAVVKPKADLVNFLQQLGYSQYAVPLAAAGFACMKELTLINMAALKKCGVLDGHALRIVDALKKKPAPSAPVTGSSAPDFMKLRKKRLAQARS